MKSLMNKCKRIPLMKENDDFSKHSSFIKSTKYRSNSPLYSTLTSVDSKNNKKDLKYFLQEDECSKQQISTNSPTNEPIFYQSTNSSSEESSEKIVSDSISQTVESIVSGVPSKESLLSQDPLYKQENVAEEKNKILSEKVFKSVPGCIEQKTIQRKNHLANKDLLNKIEKEELVLLMKEASHLNDKIHSVAMEEESTPLSIKQLIQIHLSRNVKRENALIFQSEFLSKEIPIRIAKQIKLLDDMPYGFAFMPSARKIREAYVESFTEMEKFSRNKIRTAEQQMEFTKLLNNIHMRHSGTFSLMVQSIREMRLSFLKNHLSETVLSKENKESTIKDIENNKMFFNEMIDKYELIDWSQHSLLDEFIEAFYLNRIGIRLLTGHHMILYNQSLSNEKPENEDIIGLVDTKCNAQKICAEVISYLETYCKSTKMIFPKIELFHTKYPEGEDSNTFTYIPSHLYYIVFELLRNSIINVNQKLKTKLGQDRTELMEKNLNRSPIKVIISDNPKNEDIIIKVSDLGEGIKRSQTSKVWSYLHNNEKMNSSLQSFYKDGENTVLSNTATQNTPVFDPIDAFKDYDLNDVYMNESLVGFGFPLCKAYCTYFGGDLSLISLENHGCDYYIYLKRNTEVKETMKDLKDLISPHIRFP